MVWQVSLLLAKAPCLAARTHHAAPHLKIHCDWHCIPPGNRMKQAPMHSVTLLVVAAGLSKLKHMLPKRKEACCQHFLSAFTLSLGIDREHLTKTMNPTTRRAAFKRRWQCSVINSNRQAPGGPRICTKGALITCKMSSWMT